MTSAYPFSVLGNEFKGKRVLVTGGTKGMGEAIVRRFTLSGARSQRLRGPHYHMGRAHRYSCKQISAPPKGLRSWLTASRRRGTGWISL